MGNLHCLRYQICENRIKGTVVMSELKKCPFCNNDLLDEKSAAPNFKYIRCPRCGMAGAYGLSSEQAIHFWNTLPRERQAAWNRRANSEMENS
ncbi:Lar family restriction alleviation protein [Providencia rettgeri]|uniref:Lar family restriction alleviation protein n=2 Tax=Providencia TaxID=586 RepID=UPI0034E737AB